MAAKGSYNAPSLAILPAPHVRHPSEVSLWLRRIGIGASQLLREIASGYPDEQLQAAAAWLATDLGAIVEAGSLYIEHGVFEMIESQGDLDERHEEMARLLLVGSDALGDSEELRFVVAGIRERLQRESALLDRPSET